MATFNQIKQLRLRIGDPAGVINIIQVSTLEDLPETPRQQTAYYVISTRYYMQTSLLSGAKPSDYTEINLRISDEYLQDLIDAYGVEASICKAYKWIIARLGNELVLVRNSTGAESTEYQRILDMLNYYKQVAKDCTDEYNKSQLNSTGRFYKSKQPNIAGGNI